MPTLVRNTQRGPTVFSDIASRVEITWGGRNDPEGNDFQYVPDSVVENVNFIRNLQQGIFEIVEATDPEVEAKLRAQTEAIQRRREINRQQAEAVMDRNAEQPIRTVSIDEKGQVTTVPTISEETDPTTGQPVETEIPVIIEPRQRG